MHKCVDLSPAPETRNSLREPKHVCPAGPRSQPRACSRPSRRSATDAYCARRLAEEEGGDEQLCADSDGLGSTQ